VLKTAAVALLLASSELVAFLTFRRYCRLFLAGCMVFRFAFIFYIFLSFFCSLALVVAVDESAARCHQGVGAVGRVWQQVKGRQRRVMLFVSVLSMLAAVSNSIYWQAKIYVCSNMALVALLLGVLYTIQMAAVELFQDCAMTAFYYECKQWRTQNTIEGGADLFFFLFSLYFSSFLHLFFSLTLSIPPLLHQT
jgi:hypothetical protein